jgi:hypothetical protein
MEQFKSLEYLSKMIDLVLVLMPLFSILAIVVAGLSAYLGHKRSGNDTAARESLTGLINRLLDDKKLQEEVSRNYMEKSLPVDDAVNFVGKVLGIFGGEGLPPEVEKLKDWVDQIQKPPATEL